MAAYLIGNAILALLLTALVACAIGLLSSIVFTWASNKSALWNIGFAAALVFASTVGLLLAIVLVLRQFSH